MPTPDRSATLPTMNILRINVLCQNTISRFQRNQRISKVIGSEKIIESCLFISRVSSEIAKFQLSLRRARSIAAVSFAVLDQVTCENLRAHFCVRSLIIHTPLKQNRGTTVVTGFDSECFPSLFFRRSAAQR